MAKMVICDRSGKPIEGEKATEGPDLRVSVPWCPELDNASFEDLSNEQRVHVIRYLSTLLKRGGEKDREAIMATALAYDGSSLGEAVAGEVPEGETEAAAE